MRSVTEQVVYRTRAMQRMEARYGRPMDELLYSMYVDQGMLLEDIGHEFGITKSAVSRWLAHFRVETRPGGPVRDNAA
jgi:hypothetical protein